MKKEFGEPVTRPVTVNPMRLPNALHLLLGTAALVCGAVLLLGISNPDTVRSIGFGALSRLATGMLMLLMGGLHIGMAMRYFRFTLLPGEAGDIAVPTDGGSRNDHLIKLINDGIVPSQRPADPLLSMLYGLVPHLVNAPTAIRWHAETQLKRATYLASVLLSFGLAWVFAQPAAFAWMAGLYFVLAVILLRPFDTLNAIRKGTMTANPGAGAGAANWRGVVMLLLVSIAGPLALTLSPVQVPAPPFATATVVLPTLAVLGSALIAALLFISSLIAQTNAYTSSAARHDVRENLQVPDLTRGALDRWLSRLPHPSSLYANDHAVDRDSFQGHLLAETEPTVLVESASPGLIDAFRAAWASESQRPLLGLSVFGVILGLIGLLFAFFYARGTDTAMFGLIALGFVSAAQFALASAHKLWNRVDFVSTIYRISYRGTYHRAERVAGSAIGKGTLTEGALRFGPLRVAICVASMHSVAFGRSGHRHVTSLDLLPEACAHQYEILEQYTREVREGAVRFYQEERQVRQVVNQSVSTPPPLLPEHGPAGDSAVVAT